MSSNRDSGSAIVADLVIGAAIVLVLAAAAAATGMIIDAGQASREAARSGAVELARGVRTDAAVRRAEWLAPPNASVDHEVAGGTVRVEVRSEVRLPHPVLLSKRLTIVSHAVVPIAPYRSGR
ncbi:MAG: hypothetical protein WD184_08405 [Acidimicrobiia bacterium]